MKSPYRCLYNTELLGLFTQQTPYQKYSEPVKDDQVTGCVRELRGTGVDALMICPQVWMTNLWVSEVDRRWQDEAPLQSEPLPEDDWKYYQKAYFRARRYMLEGKDPVGLTVKEARAAGLAPFISYRMNEAHYTKAEGSPCHSLFWRSHPELRVAGRDNLNYLDAAVREYFLGLIFELLDRYDVDGFECDFMRHPQYFHPDQIEAGRGVMTGFVRAIRAKLDVLEKERGKKLSLAVRMPGSPDKALEIGLDVPGWCREKLVEMVTVSSFFRLSPEIEIEKYRECCPGVSVYGELHFVSQSGTAPGGYTNNINRKTSASLYHSTALSFRDRGADGISLFNFGYTRDHSFNEPRRKCYPGVEPPFPVIPLLADLENHRDKSLHLAITPGFDLLPKALHDGFDRTFPLYVPDCFGTPFSSGLLRIEADRSIAALSNLRAFINGMPLKEVPVRGELFPPLSIEGLPDIHQVRHYEFDPRHVKAGGNQIRITLFAEGYNWGHWGNLNLMRIELALYR